MIKPIPFLASALISLSGLATSAETTWLTDFVAAKKKASAEKKDLLLDFTGSDWCPPCQQLKKEVLATEAFISAAQKDFVLVELDFPRDRESQPEALRTQNSQLAEIYDVAAYPTLILTDARGRPYGQLGYQEGGPGPYLASLAELRKNRTEFQGKIAAAEKLEGLKKAAALKDALAFLPPHVLKHYESFSKELISLDPEDTTGFQAEQARHRRLETLELDWATAMEQGKPETALQLVDTYLEKEQVTGPALQDILGMKMDPLMMSNRFEEALKVIDLIIKTDPTSEIGKFAITVRPKIEEHRNAAQTSKDKLSTEKKE